MDLGLEHRIGDDPDVVPAIEQSADDGERRRDVAPAGGECDQQPAHAVFPFNDATTASTVASRWLRVAVRD